MKLSLLSILLFFTCMATAQSSIAIQVINFENNRGVCLICLYDNAKSFAGKGEPVECATVEIVNKTANVRFENVREGTYAVSVIHDANNNKKFDTNFLGIPTEGYGASNNKLPFAAAPKFNENKFSVGQNSNASATIKLRYLF